MIPGVVSTILENDGKDTEKLRYGKSQNIVIKEG